MKSPIFHPDLISDDVASIIRASMSPSTNVGLTTVIPVY
jgi:hypothetical protein